MDTLAESMDLVRNLLASEQLAVLSTQYDGQPYSNLVAFSYTDNLKYLIFVTSRNTRKYSNVLEDDRVAVLVDSRRHDTSDFQGVMAVTALGTAEECTASERGELLRVYLAKHPHLEGFASNQSNALIKIRISDYIIAGFDSVRSLHIWD
jgi:nitroimidazol reductase NimA-like FMN-containing flavoprotein (pyridoxamine 5'-phosphate oxidase superfamily)